MTVDVEVLRFTQQRTTETGVPPELRIRFVGRDGPDFSFCPRALPSLLPGQVLLLPLGRRPEKASEPWQLAGDEGYGMITRVSAQMSEPAPARGDARSFIIRELVNSLTRGDPIARFTAASLVATQDGYLEPELSHQLERSIGKDSERWAQVVGNLLLQSLNQTLTPREVRGGDATVDERDFKALSLIRLALSHLPDTATTETMVRQSLLIDLSGFADQPYYPLFGYENSPALRAAVNYLSQYARDPVFVRDVNRALREDRPGSSTLAGALISKGQKACQPDALKRAIKVVARPAADGSDVFSAIMLLLNNGSDVQRREYLATISRVKSINADYAKFLQLKFKQTLEDRRMKQRN